ncbi:MAG: hypothetical protein GEU95_18075 [Rhizobiales bacterium]|nr:hypothetical protein [Hyphomicrobiales bacterium]
MDTGALATAFIGAKTAQVQMAVAAKMMRMNADAASSIVQVLEAAQQNMDKLANVSAGIGQNLDISV